MKKLIIFLVAIIPIYGLAQSFSEKTNEICLNFETSTNAIFPFIRWASPRYERSNSPEGEVTLEVNIESELPLSQVILEVIHPDSTRTNKTYTIQDKEYKKGINQSLILDKGYYTVKISATNNSGGKVISSRVLLIGMDAIASAVSMDRKDIAILFATDKYDYWSDLVNPVYDARTIAELLKEEYGFEVEIIENASQEEVFNKLADYSQKSYNPQDQLFIFFAGHGYFDETFGEGFVVAKNSLENDRGKTTYMSHNRLRSIIDNVPCEHILLTMDVCFGGTFDPVIAANRNLKTTLDTDDEFLARKLSYKTRKYMTSGGKTYVSDGIIGKHSPFARQLIKALKTGGGNDRILTISEIRPYVEKLIPEPRLGSFGEDHNASDFVFVESIDKK